MTNIERGEEMKTLTLVFLTLLLIACAYNPRPWPDKEIQLRYNWYEDEWTYAEPEEKLRYNYMEDRYEFSK